MYIQCTIYMYMHVYYIHVHCTCMYMLIEFWYILFMYLYTCTVETGCYRYLEDIMKTHTIVEKSVILCFTIALCNIIICLYVN